MNILRYFLLSGMLTLIEGTCQAQSLYVLPQPNMPLPNNKDEMKACAYATSQGIGLNISYSINKHIVILADGNGHTQSWSDWLNDPSIMTNISNFQGDIGGGYFSKINKTSDYEFVGGVGFGNAYLYDNSYSFNLNTSGQYVHLFAQSDIGFSTRNVAAGIGLRLSNKYGFTNYKEVDGVQSGQPQSVYYLHLAGNDLFLQPCLMLSLGAKNVKINISVGLSGKLFGPDIDAVQNSYAQPNTLNGTLYQTAFVSIGLEVNINRKTD